MQKTYVASDDITASSRMRRPELSSSDTAQTRLLHPSFVGAVMPEQSSKEAARSGTSLNGTSET
jgi:hypothetical protein